MVKPLLLSPHHHDGVCTSAAKKAMWLALLGAAVIMPQQLAVMLMPNTLLLVQAQLLAPPPVDEAFYEAQCLAAKSIALNETVTFEITDGSLSFNADGRHPQQGAVLVCYNNGQGGDYGIENLKNEWFTVEGTGNIMTASTCNANGSATEIDAFLSVYQDQCITVECASSFYEPGAAGCPGLCLDSATKAGCEDGSLGTVLSFPSELGRTYYIQVWQSYNVFGGSHQFDIAPEPPCGGSVALSLSESATPRNLDSCQEAIPLRGGDLFADASDDTLILVQCTAQLERQPGNATGRWYTMVATGNISQVSACGTSVDIFTGSSCGSLTCTKDYVEYTSSGKCDKNILFETVADERYFFFISGSASLDPDFEFLVEEFDSIEPAPNDRCSEAASLTADGLTKTLSFDGVVHGSLRPDGLFFDTVPSLWYSLEGTGNFFTFEICPPDSSPNIFTGTCGKGTDRYDLIVPMYDDECMTFQFESKLNETYLVAFRNFVQGRPTNVTVWEEDMALLPPNSVCTDAIGPLSYNGSKTLGSLVDATATTSPGGKPSAHTVYYYVDVPSDGSFLRGQICRLSGESDFNVVLQVASLEYCQISRLFDSGTLVSPIESNGCRTISWKNAVNSSMQPLLIAIRAKEEFKFSISIQQEDASILAVNDQQPELYRNDNQGYVTIDLGATVQGSTANALSDDSAASFGFGFCDIATNKPGVWYALTGTGQDLAVCLTGSINTTAKLAIFGQLLDTDVVYEGCLPEATYYGYSFDCPISVRWPTTNLSVYSLLVQTDGPEEFELSLFNVTDGPALQECAGTTLSPVSESSVAPQGAVLAASMAPIKSPIGSPQGSDRAPSLSPIMSPIIAPQSVSTASPSGNDTSDSKSVPSSASAGLPSVATSASARLPSATDYNWSIFSLTAVYLAALLK